MYRNKWFSQHEQFRISYRYGPKSPLSSNMYTYLKFGLPRVFPPNMSSQRSHRAGPGPGYKGHINNGYRDSSGAISSGYDSSDNETTHRTRIPPNKQIRKFRSESDFRAIGMGNSRPSPYLHSAGNPSMSALRQHSRASIAGIHLHNQMNSGKNYGSAHYRSHSEADLLGGGTSGHDTIHDTIGRDYQRQMRHYASDAPMSNLSPSRRQSAAMALVYPNIQVHCLNIEPNLRGVSFQAKAGNLTN